MRTASAAISVEDLRRAARARLPRSVFEFFDGGAEDEITLRANRDAFERVRLVPRVLVDVASVDTSVRILGSHSKLPIAIAPTGAVGFGWPGGDVAIAKAAADFGIPYTLSTTATASIERIAREAPGRLWFQAYVLKGREFTFRLIERARDSGYEALMITVDLPVGGKRERDNRNHFAIPFRFTSRNLRDFASRPGWALGMLSSGTPVMENLVGFTPQASSASAIASSVGRNYDPAFDWRALESIRRAWPRKLILKGIVRADDAERAIGAGCDGIVVSNHGGRQLDGGLATLDALPAVVKQTRGRIPVLVDGGVRRGVDVLKAIALGAHAVMIGRATLYGACAAGEAGARRALEIVQSELVRSMQLCGAAHVGAIGADLLFRR
ncbi:MAG TPA: alpha-hydroxy acid oxidase [Burkholderiales bacterium]|nr:alpha-hydroxy acid oxidase [Burkholderiales bacterium]